MDTLFNQSFKSQKANSRIISALTLVRALVHESLSSDSPAWLTLSVAPLTPGCCRLSSAPRGLLQTATARESSSQKSNSV